MLHCIIHYNPYLLWMPYVSFIKKNYTISCVRVYKSIKIYIFNRHSISRPTNYTHFFSTERLYLLYRQTTTYLILKPFQLIQTIFRWRTSKWILQCILDFRICLIVVFYEVWIKTIYFKKEKNVSPTTCIIEQWT